MKITSFSIKRPVTIFMSILVVLMFGVVSYSKLTMDMLPSFDLPMMMVITQDGGSGPEEVESNITDPLENVLSTVQNMKNINSVSSEGSSTIMIQFEDGTDMDFASLEVREKIDMIKSILPESSSSPMIMKMNPNMMPIMSFGVSIKGYSIPDLTEWANNNIKPTLERVDGVASVDVSGAVENEIKILLDTDKIIANGVNPNSIMMAIRSESTNLPIGNITEGDAEILVRTYSKIGSLEDVKNILVSTQDGRTIKLSDIATVEMGTKEAKSFAKINGEDALIISIQKESNANSVEVSKGVNKSLDKIVNENEDFSIIKVFDQAEFIEFALDSVKMNAVVGAVLAVLILFLFLKDIRSTLIMAVAIPISVISTFILVYFAGLTLNMISLGGIAIGVGMLVDNSIVVIENIARLKKTGLDNFTAAIEGTKEVAMAITASTLTSICVFIPIVFVQGVAADIFREMALTVTFALVSSLIVSFTLVPLLASRLLKEDSFNKENKFVSKLKNVYKTALVWSLNHRKSTLGLLVISIIVGLLAFKAVGVEFFPATDQGLVSVNIQAPKGATIEYVMNLADDIQDKVKDIEEIESVAVTVNETSAGLSLVLNEERTLSDKEVATKVRDLVKDIPGAKIEVGASGGAMSMGGSPLQISIVGDDLDVLDNISNEIENMMSEVDGVIDIKQSNEKNADEIRLVVNKDKALEYGLSVSTINTAIQNYFKSAKVGTTRIDGKAYNITIYPETSIDPMLSTIENIYVSTARGAKIPLQEVVDIVRAEGYSQIERVNGARKVTISAGVTGRALGDVVKDIEAKLNQYDVEAGYKITFGGEVEQMQDAFGRLLVALLLAVALVYMVMAAQFESLINPFIIMFVVPLAFVGAMIALFLAGVTLSIPTMIGFVMLTGIIVNNGIVLIDYMNTLKEKGLSTRDAILEAGPTRLQPILMTTLTTVIGLIPMALGIGEGSEIQMPLALTVIGGLIFGTVLTLVIVPVLYSYTEGRKDRVN